MGKKEILVVDDEEVIRDLLNIHFTEESYCVNTAANAKEALEILGNKGIQVIFLDIHLPDMNGLDLCRQIRNEMPAACIFAITGYSSIFDLLKCRGAGFDDYFPKPFEVASLDKAVNDAFEKLDRWRKR